MRGPTGPSDQGNDSQLLPQLLRPVSRAFTKIWRDIVEPGFVKTGNKDYFDPVHKKHMNGLAYSACVFFKG